MPKILITGKSIFSVKLFIEGLFSIIRCIGLITKGYSNNVVHEDHDTRTCSARYINCDRGSKNKLGFKRLTVGFHYKVIISYMVDVHVVILFSYSQASSSYQNTRRHTSLWNWKF